MSLTFERWYPWLFGAAVAALAWLLEWRLPGEDALPSLLSAAISVSAILVGFMATMKSILMAVPTMIAGIKAADFLEDVASYLMVATSGGLVYCVINIAGFFSVATTWPQCFTVVWFGSGVFALLAFWRVMRIMTALLRRA